MKSASRMLLLLITAVLWAGGAWAAIQAGQKGAEREAAKMMSCFSMIRSRQSRSG